MKIIHRIYLLLLVASALLIAQILPGTLADITGDAAAHRVSATSQGARWVQFTCPLTNSAAVRIGDSNVGTSRGTAIAAGGGFMLPPIGTAPISYDLRTIYYYAASGDKLTVSFGK